MSEGRCGEWPEQSIEREYLLYPRKNGSGKNGLAKMGLAKMGQTDHTANEKAQIGPDATGPISKLLEV